MKVLILGAGGVGGFLGALLVRVGHEVLFVDRAPEHVEAINRSGLKVNGQESFTIQAKPLPDQREKSGVLQTF